MSPFIPYVPHAVSTPAGPLLIQQPNGTFAVTTTPQFSSAYGANVPDLYSNPLGTALDVQSLKYNTLATQLLQDQLNNKGGFFDRTNTQLGNNANTWGLGVNFLNLGFNAYNTFQNNKFQKAGIKLQTKQQALDEEAYRNNLNAQYGNNLATAAGIIRTTNLFNGNYDPQAAANQIGMVNHLQRNGSLEGYNPSQEKLDEYAKLLG